MGDRKMTANYLRQFLVVRMFRRAEAREDDWDPAPDGLRAVKKGFGGHEEPFFRHGRVYIWRLPRNDGRAVEEYLHSGALHNESRSRQRRTITTD